MAVFNDVAKNILHSEMMGSLQTKKLNSDSSKFRLISLETFDSIPLTFFFSMYFISSGARRSFRNSKIGEGNKFFFRYPVIFCGPL